MPGLDPGIRAAAEHDTFPIEEGSSFLKERTNKLLSIESAKH
jgi:hypothetical protein